MKLTIPIARGVGLVFVLVQVVALYPMRLHAQTPVLNLTAKSANVAESGTPVKVSIFRWSTDTERKPIADALDPEAQAAAQAAAAAGARGGGGRGGRGGRGARAGLDPDDPAQADVDATPARGGRGGRGGRAGGGAPAAPPDPIVTFTVALNKAPTVGYLWTNEVVGYSIKYAYHTPSPDGGERIILLTDRRLGAGSVGWKPVATPSSTNYEFTLIELHMDAKGSGEGKASLGSKVIFDNQAKTPALDNYATTPAILQNIKR